VLGNYGRPRAMSERTAQAIEHSWDYVAFALNSVVFLLIGLDVPIQAVVDHLGVVLGAAAIALLARAAPVYLLLGSLHLVRSGVSLRWQHLIVWGGLRGTVALALALSISGRGGQFAIVTQLVYGVVLVSLLVQGTTIGPLTRAMLRPAKDAELPRTADGVP
jgi:CPA1 family monovalent cation:H+ antiporter